MKRQQDLGIASSSSSMEDGEGEGEAVQPPVEGFESHARLAEEGRKITVDTLKGYLRSALPSLPEEAVEAVVTSLTEDKLLAHVSFHIGTVDLILSEVRGIVSISGFCKLPVK